MLHCLPVIIIDAKNNKEQESRTVWCVFDNVYGNVINFVDILKKILFFNILTTLMTFHDVSHLTNRLQRKGRSKNRTKTNMKRIFHLPLLRTVRSWDTRIVSTKEHRLICVKVGARILEEI